VIFVCFKSEKDELLTGANHGVHDSLSS